MPSSTMWTNVLQATAIYTASRVFVHHTSEAIFRDVLHNPAVSNYTDVLRNASLESWANTTFNFTRDATSTPIALPTGTTHAEKGSDDPEVTVTVSNTANPTASNPASSTLRDHDPAAPASFYKTILPAHIVAMFVMCTLQYYWLIGLERAFPARSWKLNVPVKEKVELSESREDEIVQKWIAQGRVRRASLNWCNTLLKWVLSLTIGRLWRSAVFHVVTRALELESPQKIWDDMFAGVVTGYLGSFVSITPMADLIAFAVVPASRQVVFVAGAHVLFEIFFIVVIRVITNWVVQTNFVQGGLQNVTDDLGRKLAKESMEPKNEL